GIAVLRQGRVSEAVDELETSYRDQPSARAALYLNEARMVQVRDSGADKTSPALRIMAPEPPARVAGTTVEIVGVARDDTYVRSVYAGGRRYPLRVARKEVEFSCPVNLDPGENLVAVRAKDIVGRTTTVSVSIYSDLDGPTISFDSPAGSRRIVRGVVYDPAGIKFVRINGVSARIIDKQDGGPVEFETDRVVTGRDASIHYECADALGNVTRGSIPPPDGGIGRRDVWRPRIINALWTGGSAPRPILAVQKAVVADDRPRVRFTNVLDGQRYFADSIIVGVDVFGASPVETVTMNGYPLDTIPGRRVQHLSRRVSLAHGPNEIAVVATDTKGRTTENRLTVERVLTAIETPANRLNVAVVGNIARGVNPATDAERAAIVTDFSSELKYRDRFTLLDRSLLPEVITEQTLSASLASMTDRLALGKMIPAELMFVTRSHRDSESIEIVLFAVSTETGVVVTRLDVAGRLAGPDDIETLARNLAEMAVQEFPRVQGDIRVLDPPAGFRSTLSRMDGVRKSMKCLVWRYGDEVIDPVTGKSMGRDIDTLGEAIISTVTDKYSVAELVKPNGKHVIKVGDHVITK
ncbi:MAG: hypothetical protein J7M12_04800, partial [Candidatus Hydrogenedentes bacterium]|nr:hypothetical protein [Candidatus Hydrogenedentota bacterium]